MPVVAKKIRVDPISYHLSLSLPNRLPPKFGSLHFLLGKTRHIALNPDHFCHITIFFFQKLVYWAISSLKFIAFRGLMAYDEWSFWDFHQIWQNFQFFFKNHPKIEVKNLVVLVLVDIVIVIRSDPYSIVLFNWTAEHKYKVWARSDHYYYVNEYQKKPKNWLQFWGGRFRGVYTTLVCRTNNRHKMLNKYKLYIGVWKE